MASSTASSVAKGERVSGGQEVTKVVNLSDLRIEAAVLEHDLPLIKVGGQALVSTAADPTRQAIGRVVAVLPLVDSTTRAGPRLRARARQRARCVRACTPTCASRRTA